MHMRTPRAYCSLRAVAPRCPLFAGAVRRHRELELARLGRRDATTLDRRDPTTDRRDRAQAPTAIMKLALAFLGATAVAFTAPQTTSTRGLYPVVCVASAHHKYSGKLNLHESLGGADARHATVAAPGKHDEVRDRV